MSKIERIAGKKNRWKKSKIGSGLHGEFVQLIIIASWTAAIQCICTIDNNVYMYACMFASKLVSSTLRTLDHVRLPISMLELIHAIRLPHSIAVQHHLANRPAGAT